MLRFMMLDYFRHAIDISDIFDFTPPATLLLRDDCCHHAIR